MQTNVSSLSDPVLQSEAVRSDRDFLSTVLDSMDALVIILDGTGKVVRFNKACERLFGYTAQEIRRKLTTGVLPLPAGITALKDLLASFRARANQNQYETEWVDSSGAVRTIAWTVSCMMKEEGRVEYFFATGIDITSRRLAETLLERERALLQGLINSVPDIVFYKDISGVYVGCNTAFETFRLEASTPIIGRTDLEIYGPDLAALFSASDKSVLDSGQTVSYENWTVDSSGKPTLLETRKNPYYSPDGEMLGVIGIGRDITPHRMAEEALIKAKSEIEQLIASMSSLLIVLTPDEIVTRWNPAAERIIGLTGEQMAGTHLAHANIQWDWPAIQANIQRCKQDLKPIFLDPVRFKRQDGRDGFLGINVSPIVDDDRLSGLIILGGDITERKLLESRLVQAQKLESIGQLAAGIAHEINTPIQYVGDNTLFLQDSLRNLFAVLDAYAAFVAQAQADKAGPSDWRQLETAIAYTDLEFLRAEIPTAIQQTLDGIYRVGDIVRSMREFSHPGVREKALMDINHAIGNTLTVTKNEWKYVAQVELDLAEDLPKISCLPGEINQALLNILVNAAQAVSAKFPRGEMKGCIAISTRQTGEWLEIRIRDNGEGIPKAIESRIFEPFFTTKDVGKGTGQGLAIAYDVIVHKHQGALLFESQPGEGTTFIIRLPLG